MAKPIWELEPERMDAELERARQAHHERATPSSPRTTKPPPLPAALAAGTNRSKNAAVGERGRVIEIEAEYDEEFDFEARPSPREFEALQTTAEIAAPLLSQLRAQTANAKASSPFRSAGAVASGRTRQPAITPTYQHAAAASQSEAPSQSEVSTLASSAPPVAAKASVPATTAVPRTVSAEVPSKVVRASDTAYSMVRKQTITSPPKKR